MKIDVGKLNERFAGRRVKILTLKRSGRNDVFKQGICKSITIPFENEIGIVFEKGGSSTIRPEKIAVDSVTGSIHFGGIGPVRHRLEIDLSIADAHAYRLELEAQAKERTDLIALQLSQVIPESLVAFATDWRLIPADGSNQRQGWALPEFIEMWIESTRLGKESFVSVYAGMFKKYGFVDLEDAKKKLRSLIRAWKSALHIRLYEHEHEGQIVELRLCIKVKGIQSNKKS